MKKFYMCFWAFLWCINPAAAEINDKSADIAYVQQLVTKNDYTQLQNLINHGLNVNSRDANGDTLLLYTLINGGSIKVANLLIENGADVNAPSMSSGITPLLVATSTAKELQIQALQIYQQNMEPEKKAIVEADLKKQMSRQMLRATKILQLLIDSGADVNQETPYGTPLMNAAGNEWNSQIINMLLKAGADVNQQDRNGRTALFYAEVNHADKIISQLMSAGANVDVKDYLGKTYMEVTPEDMTVE